MEHRTGGTIVELFLSYELNFWNRSKKTKLDELLNKSRRHLDYAVNSNSLRNITENYYQKHFETSQSFDLVSISVIVWNNSNKQTKNTTIKEMEGFLSSRGQRQWQQQQQKPARMLQTSMLATAATAQL